VIVARKTSRLIEQLEQAEWKPSPKTDADEQCEFVYQPDGWKKAHWFIERTFMKKMFNAAVLVSALTLITCRPGSAQDRCRGQSGLREEVPVVPCCRYQRLRTIAFDCGSARDSFAIRFII